VTTFNWIEDQSRYLTGTFILKEVIDKTVQVQVYQTALQQWSRLSLPCIRTVEQFQIELVENKAQVEVIVEAWSEFQSVTSQISTLTSFEKLFIIQQSLVVESALRTTNQAMQWQPSRLWVHKSGVIKWLPPFPQVSENEDNENDASFINFFLWLFNYKNHQPIDLDSLLKNGELPLEWYIFIKYYFSDKTGKNNLSLLKLFTLLFYQMWPYNIATCLSMKDKLLTVEEYTNLCNFGHQLNLSKTQIEKLIVISQYENIGIEDILTLIQK